MIDPQYIVSNRALKETKEYRKLLKKYKYYKDFFYMRFFLMFFTHALFVLGNFILIHNPSNLLISINYIGFAVILIELLFIIFVLVKNYDPDFKSTISDVAFFFVILQFCIIFIAVVFLIATFFDHEYINEIFVYD